MYSIAKKLHIIVSLVAVIPRGHTLKLIHFQNKSEMRTFFL